MTTEDVKREMLESLANHYANFMRERHIEPDVPTLNKYLKQLGNEEELRISSKLWSKVREIAFSKNDDLKDFAFNDSDFTDEYFDNLEKALKENKKFIITTAVTGKAAKIDFYKTLQNWAAQNNAQILLLPSVDIKNSSKTFQAHFDPVFKMITHGLSLIENTLTQTLLVLTKHQTVTT